MAQMTAYRGPAYRKALRDCARSHPLLTQEQENFPAVWVRKHLEHIHPFM
jgi:hypothetical protein